MTYVDSQGLLHADAETGDGALIAAPAGAKKSAGGFWVDSSGNRYGVAPADTSSLGDLSGLSLSDTEQDIFAGISSSLPAVNREDIKAQTEAELAGSRASLTGKYDTAIQQATQAQEQQTKALGGQMGTSRRFSSSAQAFIKFVSNENAKKIAELEVQRDDALTNFDFKMAQLIDQRIQNEQTAQQNTFNNIMKVMEVAQKQEEKKETEAKLIKDGKIKSEKDLAILNASSEQEDPVVVFKNLKDAKDEEGNPLYPDLRLTDVLDIKDALKDSAAEEFQGVVGEWKDAIRAGAIEEDITLFEYINEKDPEKALQLKKLGLDIKKAEKDLRGTAGDALAGTSVGTAISDSIRVLKFATVADRKDAEAFVRDLIAAGRIEDAKEALLSYVSNSSAETERATIAGKDDSIRILGNIQEKLNEYIEKGGNTGVFTGLSEKALQSIGTTVDPKLAEVANDIAIAIIDYRRAVSGAAFTESEGKAYEGVFPSVGKTPELNAAKINSLINKFEDDKESYLKRKIGERKYKKIFGGDSIMSEEEDASLSDEDAYEVYLSNIPE